MHADSDEADADDPLARANDCGHDVLAAALADTEHLVRRPRRLQAEYSRVWIRTVVFSMRKRWDGILTARDRLGAPMRTIWRAIAPAPAAPALDRERMLRIFAANIRIAEESGNRRAAEFLRQRLRRFETRGRAD
jgi:hypothetical protein